MARIRSVKPELWDDRKLAKRTSRDARLLYIGLWNHADEWSRLGGDPQWLKGQIFPYDDDIDAAQVEVLLKELEAADRIIRYEADGDPYIFLPTLAKHQRLEAADVPSKLPEPPGFDADAYLSQLGSRRPARRANGSGRDANKSASHADESALLYVAGSMEHVAGSMDTSVLAGETPAVPLREDVEQLCDHLADRIAGNGSARPTVTKRWRDACRLLLDRDGHTSEQVRAAIDWCQDDEFWRANIRSMPTLREQYDRLRLEAQRKRGRSNGHPPEPRLSAADLRVAQAEELKQRARARREAGQAAGVIAGTVIP